MQLHGSAAALEGRGVLFLASSGGGKSDLLLRLLDHGWSLVADDQVMLRPEGDALILAPVPALAGMLEVRGLGVVSGLRAAEAELVLVCELVPPGAAARLPAPERWLAAGASVPLLRLDPALPSAPARLRMALDVLAGRLGMAAGAFAA